MRALCGAIITAGALIGLGLVSLGIGMRYASYPAYGSDGQPQFVYLRHLDTALMISFVALLISVAIGLGIAFVGLAYHHQRRHLELTRGHATASGATTAAGTSDRVSA
jgi:ABC-type phosphate transport system permease subunit